MLFMGLLQGMGGMVIGHGDKAWGQDDPARRWLSMMMGMMAGDAGGLWRGIMRGYYAGGLWRRAGHGIAQAKGWQSEGLD